MKKLPASYKKHSSGLWVPKNGGAVYKEIGDQWIAMHIGKRGKAPNHLYPYVCYKGKRYYVHQLVVETYLKDLPYVEKKAPKGTPLEINHIDHNVKNYKVSNLERVTRAQNQSHRYGHKFYRSMYRREDK